jgi:hypothetical protein
MLHIHHFIFCPWFFCVFVWIWWWSWCGFCGAHWCFSVLFAARAHGGAVGIGIGVVGILVIRVLGDLLLVLLEFFHCEDFVYLLISQTVLVLRSITLLIKFSR